MTAPTQEPDPEEIRRIIVEAELPLYASDIEKAGGDLTQAAQNLIGCTGARVMEVVADG